MSIELTITVKDADRTLKKSFLIYEPISFTETDPMIKKCIDEVTAEFAGEPDDIRIRANMVVR